MRLHLVQEGKVRIRQALPHDWHRLNQAVTLLREVGCSLWGLGTVGAHCGSSKPDMWP